MNFPTPKSNHGAYPKRAIDIAIAFPLLVITAPLILIASLLVFFTMGRPILFVHTRPGLHGRPFDLFKLRTMSSETDAQGRLLPQELRLTRTGKILRTTSLDELPQLWNVLRGDMSLIGPRPLLMEYLDLYTPEQARRHEVRPGITGWAQVNGRNALNWESRFRLDVWYVDNWSLWLDMRILWLTLLRVLHRKGVDFEGGALSQPYRGSAGADDGTSKKTEDFRT